MAETSGVSTCVHQQRRRARTRHLVARELHLGVLDAEQTRQAAEREALSGRCAVARRHASSCAPSAGSGEAASLSVGCSSELCQAPFELSRAETSDSGRRPGSARVWEGTEGVR